MDLKASISSVSITEGATIRISDFSSDRRLAAGDVLHIEHPEGAVESVTVAAVAAEAVMIESAGGNGQYLLVPDSDRSESWRIKEQIHQGS